MLYDKINIMTESAEEVINIANEIIESLTWGLADFQEIESEKLYALNSALKIYFKEKYSKNI